MNFEKKNSLNKLNQMLEFKSSNQKAKLEEELLSLKFIATIEELLEQNDVNRSDLANILDSSKSYVSQVFSGDKMINIRILAKIQRALNVSFKLYAVDNNRFQFEKVSCNLHRRINLQDYLNADKEQVYKLKKISKKDKIPA
jgi:transcriptional regulator with XRE-family HTH domain